MTTMRQLILAAMLALLLAPLAACGKKAAPSPPTDGSKDYPHIYPRKDPDLGPAATPPAAPAAPGSAAPGLSAPVPVDQ